jgi:AraC-like DNA-binding protein
MGSIQFTIVPPSDELARDVAFFRSASYEERAAQRINVCPNGLPGIVLQHSGNQPAVERIVTSAGRTVPYPPTLFLYGQITTPSIMHFVPRPYTTLQVLLKPHALRLLLGADASQLTNDSLSPASFGAEALHQQLLATQDNTVRIDLFTRFLTDRLANAAVKRDMIIEQSLALIEQHIGTVTTDRLIQHSGLSERQFQRRFRESAGVTPQWYIRVRRFHKAMELMDAGRYARLADVAHALNFHDQSHFIHDIRAFSGITPRGIGQKVHEFYHDQVGNFYAV